MIIEVHILFAAHYPLRRPSNRKSKNKSKIVLLHKKLPYILDNNCAKYYSLDVELEHLTCRGVINTVRKTYVEINNRL